MTDFSPADFFALGNAAARETAELRERLARAGVPEQPAANDDVPADA